METEALAVDRAEALAKAKAWRDHQGTYPGRAVDRELARIYGMLAKGKTIIRALHEIERAGLGPDGWPKLAIGRADWQFCHCHFERQDAAIFSARQFPRGREKALQVAGFPPADRKLWRARAKTPHIPPEHLPPKTNLANCHILWEAAWDELEPADPLLLRRLGAADLWLVLAAWDLTPIEQMVLNAHIARDIAP